MKNKITQIAFALLLSTSSASVFAQAAGVSGNAAGTQSTQTQNQNQGGQTGTDKGEKAEPQKLTAEELKVIEEFRKKRADEAKRIADLANNGMTVRVGDIAGFRGAQSNVVMGYGLVVGLDGTGDSKQTPFTAKLLANAMSKWGTIVDATQLQGKNIATVTVTAEIPAFAAPGRKLDITVQSIGDAKSLAGGFLLPTPLMATSDPTVTYILASGGISIGGFSAESGGGGGGGGGGATGGAAGGAATASVRKNHQNVGRIPDGGDVQMTPSTQIIFPGNKLFLDLDDPDFTTAQRVAGKISEAIVDYKARTIDAVTIEIIVPEGTNPVEAISRIESLEVKANLPSSVVINERTGTVVVGGNVKLGPAIIIHGALQVRIDPEVMISQPLPKSDGKTTVVEIPRVEVTEGQAQIGLIAGAATISDLAKVLQTLQISARDIISIFQALSEQGALKARIRIQ